MCDSMKACVLIAWVSVWFSAAAAAQVTPITTVNVESSPQVPIADTVNGKVFVANFSSDTVSVISAETYAVTATIPAGDGPRRMRINTATNRLYVVNRNSNNVTVINTSTNAVVKTIALPAASDASNIQINVVTNRIYVNLRVANQVAVIDGATDTLMSPLIGVGTTPVSQCVNTATNRIFSANFGSDTVSVIDGATNTVIATPTVGDGPTGCLVDETTNRIFVANETAGTASIISGNTNAVAPFTLALGPLPGVSSIAVTENLLVFHNTQGSTIQPFELDTLLPLGAITTGAAPWTVFIDPSVKTMYVTNRGANTVSVIDLYSLTVRQTIPVGANPQGIARHFQNFYVVNNNNGGVGSVSAFKRVSFRQGGDLSADGSADLTWRNTSTLATAAWLMNGASVLSGATILGPSSWEVAFRSDLDGDGFGDILWRNSATTETAVWLMNGLSPKPGGSGTILGPSPFTPVAAGGFDGSAARGILWRNPTSGSVAIWLMNNNGLVPSYMQSIYGGTPAWEPVLLGNFNGDFHSDIVWRNNSDGQVALWMMQGNAADGLSIKLGGTVLGPGTAWVPEFAEDLDGDGRTDIVWRNTSTNDTAIWLMKGLAIGAGGTIVPGATGWTVKHVRDLDGDLKADLIWRNSITGATAVWLMNGLAPKAGGGGTILANPDWEVTHHYDLNNDLRGDLVWRNQATGQTALWLMDGLTQIGGGVILNDPNWSVVPLP